MADQLTLIAPLDSVPSGETQYEVRSINDTDRDALGRLYFESYEPGLACETLEEAIDDIDASFNGEYGAMVKPASLVAIDGSSLIGAVMTVRRPPWEGFPDCPFIIELFVDRGHRGRGIGRALVQRAMTSLSYEGEYHVALRVDPGNSPAMRLYEFIGFEDGRVIEREVVRPQKESRVVRFLSHRDRGWRCLVFENISYEGLTSFRGWV